MAFPEHEGMSTHLPSSPSTASAATTSSAPASRAGRRLIAIGAAALVLIGGLVVGVAQPASALVSVSTSGTTMTVTLTGTETLIISCIGGTTRANGAPGSPAVACNQLTKLTVNGDAAGQTVDGSDLDDAAFSAKPTLTVVLGAGVDTVTETTRGDNLDLGAGDDRLYLVPDTTSNVYEMGADNDWVRYSGTEGVDTILASSTNTFTTLTRKVGNVTNTSLLKSAETLEAGTYGGNDVIDFGGITAASGITKGNVYAGAGNDTIVGSQKYNTLEGGSGTNSFTGGDGKDDIFTLGNDDTIDGKGGSNWIYDRQSGRSGRTLSPAGTDNWYFNEVGVGDSVLRIRPGSSNTVTASLARPGQQVLPSSFENVVAYHGANALGESRGLFDVVALGNSRDVVVDGDAAKNDVLDVTIPTGSWTVGITNGSGWITPTAPGYKPIHVLDMGAVKVHGPWTDKNKGYVHRATRDLMFRFATDQDINATAAALANATTTRKAVAEGLMDTDEYRGLDVDRIFTRYLARQADPAGREYWINSLAGGKPMWKFRAQLFGSNEYFNKAGANNAAYLDRVYLDVLGRLPDPSGRQYWTNKLDAGADRGAVALQFINSSEFRRFIVEDQFLRFLDRKPTSGEISTWAGKITSSPTGEQDLIAHLVTTDEYFNRS